MPIDETRAFRPVRIALLTVSDTRTAAEDKSGDILADRIAAAGHILAERALLKDDAADIVALLHRWVEAPCHRWARRRWRRVTGS